MKKLETIEMMRLSLEDFRQCTKIPLSIVVDNVRSMNNLGSILRTADAFRIERVYLCGITAQPPHPDIHKTALGAEDSVDWIHLPDTPTLLRDLRQQGYQLLALEQATDSISLEDFSPELDQRYALVIGNEVHGVSQASIDCCHHCLEIPQLGVKHSLNVSVATGIAIWQIVKPFLKTLQ